ncbi:putative oxidoreductase YxbG [Colletotrichum viniferum]|nr:putative oxidoreductase YxbG [Colletotrichum viniferum]
MSSTTIQTISPSTNKVFLNTPSTSLEDAKAIAKSSHDAFQKFKLLSLAERKEMVMRGLKLIQERKHDLGRELSQQMGRPIAYSHKEIETMQKRADYFLDIAEESLRDIPGRPEAGFKRWIKKVPVGPTLVVFAWNFPYLIIVNALVPALLAGNTVILKPSPQTPLVGTRIAEIFAEAGLPKNVLQVVQSGDPTVLDELVKIPEIQAVSFTGSTAGGCIGLEAAILMYKEVASVLMTDINQAIFDKALFRVKELSTNSRGRLELLVIDVSRESEVEKAVAHLDSWGGLDVIFNNAGIMHPKDGDAEECPADIWDKTFDINVKGVWYGSKYAVRSLRKHGKKKGSIINTASMVSIVGSATPQVAYTASKGAVMAFTREMAIVHAREGLRFNTICPAPLNTPMLQDFLGDDKEKRFRREVHFPTGRFGEAIEQAQAAVFLASEESSFVNAHDLVVDGGLTKAYVTPDGPPTEPPRNLGKQ